MISCSVNPTSFYQFTVLRLFYIFRLHMITPSKVVAKVIKEISELDLLSSFNYWELKPHSQLYLFLS